MNIRKNFTLLLVAAATFAGVEALACTNLLVGKKASTDGSTLITYAADAHVLYGDLQYLPAADHQPGSMRDIRDWDSGVFLGKIDEVPHTYAVVGNINAVSYTHLTLPTKRIV